MADLSLSRNTACVGTACVGDQSFVSTWTKDALVLGAYIYMVNVPSKVGVNGQTD